MKTSIRRRVLRRLICVYTVCQYSFYGTLCFNGLSNSCNRLQYQLYICIRPYHGNTSITSYECLLTMSQYGIPILSTEIQYTPCDVMANKPFICLWQYLPVHWHQVFFHLEKERYYTQYSDWLTHSIWTPHKKVIGKQCRPRSDAAERGIWSGFALFA